MGARLNINQSNPTDKIDAKVLAKSNIFLTPPPLAHCVEDSSGVGSFTRIAHGHKSEALRPFLIEDDFRIDYCAILAEENHQVWIPEAEGEI